MKTTIQLLLLSLGLLLYQNARAAVHFDVKPVSQKEQSVSKKSIKKHLKKWTTSTKKTKRKKHPERWFLGIILGLTGLFVGLKLSGIILWSWLWVLAPIWIIAVLMILILIYVTLLFLFMSKPKQLESLPKEEFPETESETDSETID